MIFCMIGLTLRHYSHLRRKLTFQTPRSQNQTSSVLDTLKDAEAGAHVTAGFYIRLSDRLAECMRVLVRASRYAAWGERNITAAHHFFRRMRGVLGRR